MASSIDKFRVVDVERDQAFKRFDQMCQRYLQISGYDFVTDYRRGAYRNVDVDSVEGLSKILSILPFAGI
jgi:hypothetical protein